jgi:hypothetical protein
MLTYLNCEIWEEPNLKYKFEIAFMLDRSMPYGCHYYGNPNTGDGQHIDGGGPRLRLLEYMCDSLQITCFA